MKKSTFFTGLLTLMFSTSAIAQDLTIGAADFVIEESGILDQVTGCIQNTSQTTRICLGEVDFGEDGNRYQAAGIDFAQGWGDVNGWAVLHAGQDYENSQPFTQMLLDETHGYQIYYTFADSMAYLRGPNHDGVFEGIAVPGTQYVKPVGKQKVWLTFVGCSGNIRSVKFFEEQLTPEDFVQEEDGRPAWWGTPVLRFPSERSGYSDISVKKLSTDSEPMVAIGEEVEDPESPFKGIKLDGDSWGWTCAGFVVDYGTVDFSNGYDQVIVYVKRDSDPNPSVSLEIYIDEVKDENMIASIWGGLHMQEIYPIAKNIEPITGTHKVIVKWTSGGPNLQAVEFSKGADWEEGLVCGIEIVDQLPSENALRVSFENSAEGILTDGTNPNGWGCSIMTSSKNEHFEDAGNVGFTHNGTVLNFFDVVNGYVNFGDGQYKSIVVEHSCDKVWLGEVEDASFDFYLDLDPDLTIPKEAWNTDLASILEGHEPIARVRIQGTGAWDIRKHVAGAITGDLSGEHDLYMVYNIKNDADAGANVFNIYFDTQEVTGVQQTAADVEGVEVYASNGKIMVNSVDPVKVTVYTLSGSTMSETVASSGTNTYDAASGFYIVKVTDKNGAVGTYKVLVK